MKQHEMTWDDQFFPKISGGDSEAWNKTESKESHTVPTKTQGTQTFWEPLGKTILKEI